jgi:SAM-dependent methyltransferase
MVASSPGRTDRSGHWDSIYQRAGVTEVSWYQPEPSVSVELIGHLGLPANAAIIDIGGGASTLVDALLARGYRDLTVLDVSTTALDAARGRLGPGADTVNWLHEDLVAWEPSHSFDVWHDRAVFHFLVEAAERAQYRQLVRRAVRPSGHVIIGTFAPDGPTRCSGLAVQRYDPDGILEAFGAGFDLVASRREEHTTPAGVIQPFAWAVLRSRPDRHNSLNADKGD